ncbi:Purine nucleoside receptor A [uncultured Eubacterium sp.]|nr:Purine nucleoside receptor A [uncultured Eubacterium sp.]
MKKFISLTLVAVMVLSMSLFMASCGGDDKEAGGDAEKTLRVRCVVSTQLGDQSFNDSAKKGIDQLKEEGYDATLLECNNDPKKWEQNLITAAEDADMVIAVGSELDMVGEVSKDFPKVKFIWCDNKLDNPEKYPNVMSVTYKQNEGSYLVGWIAGKMTKSNVVGFIGGMDIPVINDFRVGYAQGAKDANDKVKVVKNYTGNWGDTNAGAESAQVLAQQGADIIFCAAGGSGTGAIGKAEELGIKCIGVDADQRQSLKEYADFILCSMVKEVGKSIVDTVKAYEKDEKSFKGGDSIALGMDGGYIGVAYGADDQKVLVSDDIKAELDGLIEKIANGDIKVETKM